MPDVTVEIINADEIDKPCPNKEHTLDKPWMAYRAHPAPENEIVQHRCDKCGLIVQHYIPFAKDDSHKEI